MTQNGGLHVPVMAASNSKRSSFSSVCTTSFKQSYMKLPADGLVGYREANRMLCDRFYNVEDSIIDDRCEVFKRPSMPSMLLRLPPIVKVFLRMLDACLDERRRVMCSFTIADLLHELTDHVLGLDEASLRMACQIH